MNDTRRVERWLETSSGYQLENGNIASHSNQRFELGKLKLLTRIEREEVEAITLSEGATHSNGAGSREIPEEPDLYRTSFERDRDRILHSQSFRRLAGKTQVFIFPGDHQRTRLTHALEVAQVANSISKAVGLNVPLTEAIALGHDCGHGPGGHASEDAFSLFIEGGYDHALWGADHTLRRLNLCAETIDGIRNHSWSRPQPSTPEGIVVSFADRIAYCAHDLEDAISAGIITSRDIPLSISKVAGMSRTTQLNYFIHDMISTIIRSGEIALSSSAGEALAQLREFNYFNIYATSESKEQSEAVITLLSKLVKYFIEHPNKLSLSDEDKQYTITEETVAFRAVDYVAGMTDRFAFHKAIELLQYDINNLPRGIDLKPLI